VAVVILHVTNMKLVTTKFKSGGLHEKHIYRDIVYIIFNYIRNVLEALQLVEALRYKPEGRGFDSRRCDWNFLLTYSFRCRTVVLGLTQSITETSKAVPLQAWSGPEGSRKLRFPDFMTTAQDGGKVVSLTHRPPLPPENAPGSKFF